MRAGRGRRTLGKGDAVCLLMPNRPEYLALWLGITRVGGVVALLNTNLTGTALAYCINVVTPKHIIVAAELLAPLESARGNIVSGAASSGCTATPTRTCRASTARSRAFPATR